MYQDPEGIVLPARSRGDRNIQRSSAGHCTGYAVLGEGEGTRVQAESWLELCNLNTLNARLDVVALKEQEAFHYGWTKATMKTHFFDVVASMSDGARIAYTVKPQPFVNRASKLRGADGRILDHRTFLEKMREISWWAVEKTQEYDDVRLITKSDIDPIDLRNAEIFNRVRQVDQDALDAARKVVSEMPEGSGRSLRELTLDAGASAEAYRALLHLMRKGELRCIAREIISPKSIVTVTGR